MQPYIIVVICVIGMSVGQILFKLSAESLKLTGSIFSYRTFSILLGALVLYLSMTLAWVWVLQKIDLGKAYPLMALAFILVPMGSYFVFSERFSLQYIIGSALIVVGVFVIAKS